MASAKNNAVEENNVKSVSEGTSLALIPLAERSEKVCFFASLKMPIDRTLFGYFADAQPSQQWADTVLPHIPLQVLYFLYLRGGLPFEYERQNSISEKDEDERQAHIRRMLSQKFKGYHPYI